MLHSGIDGVRDDFDAHVDGDRAVDDLAHDPPHHVCGKASAGKKSGLPRTACGVQIAVFALLAAVIVLM